MEIFSHLPDALIMEIFSHLPAKSLCRFKCLSKFWLSFIEDPAFIEKTRLKTPLKWQFPEEEQVRVYSIDNNGFATHVHTHKFGSHVICFRLCDGLICYLDDDYDLCMYNLTTKEAVLLPEWCRDFEFSFDPLSKKYKILGWKRRQDSSILDFQVLTVEKGLSWRPVANTLKIRLFEPLNGKTAVNGKLFWKIFRQIISFNMANEEFGEIDLPDEFNGDDDYENSLFEFEGSLILVEERKEDPLFNLWILKEVGSSNIWTPFKMDLIPPFADGLKVCDYESDPEWMRHECHFSPRGGEILISFCDGDDQYIFFYSPLNDQLRIMNDQLRFMRITGLPMQNIYIKAKIDNYVENYLGLYELL